MRALRAAILLSLSGWCLGQTTPRSPCPDVFQYEPAGGGQGRWYGVIRLPANTVISSLWLNTVLDSKTQFQGSWVGNGELSDTIEFKIEHIKRRPYPTPATEVRFYVNYVSDLMIPRVAEIRLNDKEICNLKNRLPANSASSGQDKGTFYWIKLIGSQDVKPAYSSLGRPMNSVHPLSAQESPTDVYNQPDVSSWVSYITESQAGQPSSNVNVGQSWSGGVSTLSDTFKIKHIIMRISPTPAANVQFYLNYDPNLRTSSVTDIRLNGVAICNVETVQPASNTPIYKRDVTSTGRNTTPESNRFTSWLTYIGSKVVRGITGQQTKPPINTQEQNPPIEKISPLQYGQSGSDSWTAYISEQQPAQPSWEEQSSYDTGSYAQEQSDPSSWTSFISGPQTGPQNLPVTPSPPVLTTQRPKYSVDQSWSGDNTDFSIEHVEMRIYPAPATDIWINVQYNSQLRIPKAVEIKLNGRGICGVGVAQPAPSQTAARWGGDY